MLVCKERENPQTRISTPATDAVGRPGADAVRCQGAPVFWPPRQPSAYARSLIDAPLAYDRD